MTNTYIRTTHNNEDLGLLGFLAAVWHILGSSRTVLGGLSGPLWPLGDVPGTLWGGIRVLLGALGTVSACLGEACGDLGWS